MPDFLMPTSKKNPKAVLMVVVMDLLGVVRRFHEKETDAEVIGGIMALISVVDLQKQLQTGSLVVCFHGWLKTH